MSVRLLILCLLFSLPVLSQEDNVWLHPNRGQWDSRVDYAVEVNQGSLLIGKEGFTYSLNDAQTHSLDKHEHYSDTIHRHIIKSVFQNVTWKGAKKEGTESSFYRNYYLGKDKSRWRSHIQSVEEATLIDYYEGIDLNISGKDKGLKYSFIVYPGSDPSVISSEIKGANKVYLKNGELHIVNRFGEIIEQQPRAWTTSGDGTKTMVPVKFHLKDALVTYIFPKGYDNTATLTIDPNIVFSTFTGSTRDNWGMTATPDAQGNLYAGGIVFEQFPGTYPVTTGAMDVFFDGGPGNTGFDVAITKFNATGTALLYSTYLGGTGNESVHSLVTDEQNHLYVLGVTSSANFPVTAGCIKDTISGGPNVNANGLVFPGGEDIYIAHFTPAGDDLVGCTYFGGTGSDGITSGGLYYNYGDPFRGEIIVRNGFVYIASSTASQDITLVNPFQATMNGQQDALVLKANTALTTLAWSTYVGGAGFDSGNGIQISSGGMIYVTGGSTANMPFLNGHTTSNNGGSADGYVMRMSNVNGAVLSGTFIGTAEYDQSYFVQLDLSDQVYIYGQTEGGLAISPGKYGTPNSGQFVAKYNPTLLTRTWTTSIGAGTGHVEISPTAFLVSNCGEIYLSGWGGEINQDHAPGATQSTTFGFPVTPDAYKPTTNGSNFWIAVLAEDASALKYATFMGGTSTVLSTDHVDGGTSRFDKKGNIYHAVCAACGGVDNGFPTTPGVFSPTNQSPNCNLAAFKFELSTIEAAVSEPANYICIPDPVVFSNQSENGNHFHWDFGDNTTSTEVNPSHLYSGPGVYTVTLIVTDTNLCFTPDTVSFEVSIGDFGGGIIDPPAQICPNVPFQFEAYGGINYEWTPAEFLDDPTVFNPVATVSQTTTFTCIVSDSCGIDTVTTVLNVFGADLEMSSDTTICIGNSVPLFVTGVSQIEWSPATYLDDPNSATPLSTPLQGITYTVNGVTSDGCPLKDSVRIIVEFNPPQPVIKDSLKYCEGEGKTVVVSGAATYVWSPDIDISTTTGNVVTINSQTDCYYYCDFTNSCATIRDSIYIDVINPAITAGNDTIVCPGNPVFMWADGAESYFWNPMVSFLEPAGNSVTTRVENTTTFIVTGVDAYGCKDQKTVTITTYPRPVVTASPDAYAFFGDEVPLSAATSSAGVVSWSPTEFLSCVVCMQTIATPNTNYEYVASFTDKNGCTASDKVRILYDPIIYVPNAFTPDGNALNGEFLAEGGNIKTFRMDIFNRWGELIFTTESMRFGWDGTYDNQKCPDGVYTWKIKYSDYYDKEYEKVGHVTLLR